MNPNKPYNKLLVFFLSIVVFLSAFTLIQYQGVQDQKNINTVMVKIHNDQEWNYVYGKINTLREEAKETTKLIANSIKKEIIQYYGSDKKKMRSDLINWNQDNHPIVNIFAKNILGYYFNDVQSDGDDMWIGTRESIVSDFSVDCSADGRVRNFDKETSLHFSPVLAQHALDKILSLDNGLIGWQFTKPLNPKYTFDTFTESNLRYIYETYGLEALQSFEILTSVYIDNKTDLNGEFLVTEVGQRQSNSQLIVTQGFNIVNQFKNDQVAMVVLKSFEEQKKLNTEFATRQELLDTVLMLSTFFMTIMIFIVGSVLLNREHEREFPSETEENK